MSEHEALISWTHTRGDFLKGTYSREHTWTFDGGAVIPASPALSSVPKPYSNASHVDPEEAFVASISSCHMLTYLYLAHKSGFDVAAYEDNAVGVMTKNDHGIPWMSSVILRPQVAYRGERLPSRSEEHQLHHEAHEQCYISNSVKTEIRITLAP